MTGDLWYLLNLLGDAPGNQCFSHAVRWARGPIIIMQALGLDCRGSDLLFHQEVQDSLARFEAAIFAKSSGQSMENTLVYHKPTRQRGTPKLG